MKTKYQNLIEPRLPELAGFLEAGNPPDRAAEWLGISPATMKRYRKQYPEFDRLFHDNGNLCDDLVEAALLRRATGYEDSSGKEIAPDVRAAVFWLQNRRPKRWSSSRTGGNAKNSVISIQLNKVESEL